MRQQLRGRQVLVLMSLGLGGWVLGCASSAPKVITDPDPSLKIPAIRAAADTQDFSNVRQLVRDLESDDPAVRFYSIGALEKLTGQTYGYQYFMDEERRAPAVEKWKAWLSGWQTGQSDSVKR